jgi:hypothetical protein
MAVCSPYILLSTQWLPLTLVQLSRRGSRWNIFTVRCCNVGDGLSAREVRAIWRLMSKHLRSQAKHPARKNAFTKAAPNVTCDYLSHFTCSMYLRNKTKFKKNISHTWKPKKFFQGLCTSKMKSVVWKYHLCIPILELWMSPVFIFLISFLKYNSGFIKFILEIDISFQELCISNTGKIKTST